MKFPSWIIQEAKELRTFDFSQFETVEASKYSSLMPYQIGLVNFVWDSYLKGPKLIYDLSAHIGVDTTNFALKYPEAQIIAVELDKKVCGILKKNMAGYENVEVRCSDALIEAKKIKKADLVYLDPPWGGPEYNKKDKIVLEYSKKPVSGLIANLLGEVDVIALKAPFNYDEEELLRPLAGKKVKITQYGIKKPKKTKKGDIAFYLIIFTHSI